MGHTTRTLAFDAAGNLYVSIGSAGNVDEDSYRSRIRRFSIDDLPAGGLNFGDGEVFADGLRNEVGLAFDKHGVLWGVENGADRLVRGDLGGDIHNENPAEELNRFPEAKAGRHWGYPFCWTEFELGAVGRGAGSVWAWPPINSDWTHDDSWCRAETEPSIMAMQAHSAPLGITFFNVSTPTKPPHSLVECTGGFPAHMLGDAFVGFHGSWNRDTPTDKVVHIPMNTKGAPCFSAPNDFLCHAGGTAKWPSGSRPVDVRFDSCGRLLVSDDGANQVLMIRYTSADEGSAASAGSCSATSPPSSQSSASTPSSATTTPIPSVFSTGVSSSPPPGALLMSTLTTPSPSVTSTVLSSSPSPDALLVSTPATAGPAIWNLSLPFYILSAVYTLALAANF